MLVLMLMASANTNHGNNASACLENSGGLKYLLRAGSYWNNWRAGLNWGRVGQTGTELHRLGGLLRAVSSVKQKGWFADVVMEVKLGKRIG